MRWTLGGKFELPTWFITIAFPFWTKPIGACKNQLKLPQNCSKTIVKSLDFRHLKTAVHFWTKPIGAWKNQ
jgi:hypothetical protein